MNDTQRAQAPAPADQAAAILARYRRLHDGLSEMVEDGRLEEADIPDDYVWLVASLAELAQLDPISGGNDAPLPAVR